MNIQKFGGIGLMVSAFAILGAAPFAEQARTGEKNVPHMEHAKAMQACAKACSECQRACDSCATHCAHLVAEGKKDHLKSLANCQDCATVCAAAAQIVARGGPHAVLVCESCAKSCDQCAKVCEKHPDDKHMKECAEECRKCEKACKAMVKHMAGN
jgi:hypothetical protein